MKRERCALFAAVATLCFVASWTLARLRLILGAHGLVVLHHFASNWPPIPVYLFEWESNFYGAAEPRQ